MVARRKSLVIIRLGMTVLTPPTLSSMPRPRPAWPIVIGVISVVYASLMMLCNLGAVFTPQFYGWFAQMAAHAGQPDAALEIEAEVAARIAAAYIILASAGLANSVWLLLGAIALLRRRAWSRNALRGWSVAELVLLVLQLAMLIYSTREVAEIMQQRGLAQEIDALWMENIVYICILIPLSAAWPVFLLIWFTRAKIRQQAASWDEAASK